MNIFSIDGPLMRILNLIADIISLHILWLLCSIPIVTIGASTTGLYYACMKRIRTNEGYIAKNFFSAFIQNFKQSTILWLILAAIGYLFYLDFQVASSVEGIIGDVMLVGCAIFLIPYLFVLIYIFPIQAKFENPIKSNLKNAFIMSFRHFIMTLVLIFIIGTFVILGLTFFPMVGILLICGSGLIGYLTSTVFIQIFRKYIPDEIEKDLEISGEKFRD